MRAESSLRIPSKVLLYDDRLPQNVSAKEVAGRLRDYLPQIEICVRADFVLHYTASLGAGSKEETILDLAGRFSAILVRDPEKECSFSEPAYGEIQYEKRGIGDRGVRAHGVVCDGFEFARLLGRLIPKHKRTHNYAHIVLTNQFFGTWGDDLRYHYRVSVFSVPCLTSTTGIMEAPGKPREFCVEKQSVATVALRDGSPEALKRKSGGRLIDYGDERMTEVLVGYLLQAVANAAMGNPFYSYPNCRFYDAHYQRDRIRPQLEGEEFCQYYRKLLGRLKRRPTGAS